MIAYVLCNFFYSASNASRPCERDIILKYMSAPIEDVPLKLSTDISKSCLFYYSFIKFFSITHRSSFSIVNERIAESPER